MNSWQAVVLQAENDALDLGSVRGNFESCKCYKSQSIDTQFGTADVPSGAFGIKE